MIDQDNGVNKSSNHFLLYPDRIFIWYVSPSPLLQSPSGKFFLRGYNLKPVFVLCGKINNGSFTAHLKSHYVIYISIYRSKGRYQG